MQVKNPEQHLQASQPFHEMLHDCVQHLHSLDQCSEPESSLRKPFHGHQGLKDCERGAKDNGNPVIVQTCRVERKRNSIWSGHK